MSNGWVRAHGWKVLARVEADVDLLRRRRPPSGFHRVRHQLAEIDPVMLEREPAGVDSREKWEVRDHADVDPVPFAERVEQARKEHAHLVNRGEST